MHDMNGKPLKPGDRVVIPGTITECNGDPQSTFCNVVFTPEVPMGKGTETEHPGIISLNAGQTAKVEPSCPLSEALALLKDFAVKYGKSDAGRAQAIAINHLETAILWTREAAKLCEGVACEEVKAAE